MKKFLDYETGAVYESLQECNRKNCICPYHRYVASKNRWVILSTFHKELRRGDPAAYYWADRLRDAGLGKIIGGYIHGIVFEETQSLELFVKTMDKKNVNQNIGYFLATPKNWETIPFNISKIYVFDTFKRLNRKKENSQKVLDNLIKNMDRSYNNAIDCIRYAASYMNNYREAVRKVKQAMKEKGMLLPEEEILMEVGKNGEKEFQKMYYIINRHFGIVKGVKIPKVPKELQYRKFEYELIPPAYVFDHHTHIGKYIEILEEDYTYNEMWDKFGIDLRWSGTLAGEYWRFK
ncbi:MAG: hypothetical protein ACP5MB_03400, partial [bacterium]